MRNFLLCSILIGSSFLSTLSLQAQSSTCAQTLRTARGTYDQGRLHELPVLLESCLRSGFTEQEKVEAYKLLTLSYIYLEEPAKADESMLKLLQTDPYFEINTEADPAEFIALYKTFRTWPIYRVGAKVGVNGTSPTVISHVTAVDGQSTSYTPVVNFQAGLSFEIPLRNKSKHSLVLNPEIYFILRSFYYDADLDLGDDLENSSEGKETQSWVSLPISLQYSFSKSKLNPYISLGLAADYLIAANLTMQRTRVNANSIQERSYNISAAREKINISAIASAGIKLPLGSGYVVTELRFMYGLTAINNENSAFAINDYLLFDNGYADNHIKISSLSITAGYVYNIFKPKKLSIKR